MRYFFNNNWKFAVFPLSLPFIMIVDYYLQYPVYISMVKVALFALIHFLFVLRTKYIFDSDIVRYYSNLKIEFANGFTVKSVLSTKQSKYVYYFYYFISLLLLFSLYSDPGAYELIILNSYQLKSICKTHVKVLLI